MLQQPSLILAKPQLLDTHFYTIYWLYYDRDHSCDTVKVGEAALISYEQGPFITEETCMYTAGKNAPTNTFHLQLLGTPMPIRGGTGTTNPPKLNPEHELSENGHKKGKKRTRVSNLQPRSSSVGFRTGYFSAGGHLSVSIFCMLSHTLRRGFRGRNV